MLKTLLKDYDLERNFDFQREYSDACHRNRNRRAIRAIDETGFTSWEPKGKYFNAVDYMFD
jgi:hypothetical protein